MKLAIAISGLHGTGKTTYAQYLAKKYKLRHISAGELFRQMAKERELSLTELGLAAEQNKEIDQFLDERVKKALRAGDVVVDGLLAGWMAVGTPSLKIYLSSINEVRIRRIASRDGLSQSEATKVTISRELIEKRRFKKLYNIDITELSIYDLVLNTCLLPIEQNIEVIKSFINGYINYRKEKKNVCL
jgi:cytidylate kinase